MMNVLLVDDEEICNFINMKILRRLQIADHIQIACNGRQALELFAQKGPGLLPDLVLLDLNMPVMNGFDFLAAFNKLVLPKKERVKIVILTSSNNSNDAERAKSMGASHYLTKPLSEEDLLRALA